MGIESIINNFIPVSKLVNGLNNKSNTSKPGYNLNVSQVEEILNHVGFKLKAGSERPTLNGLVRYYDNGKYEIREISVKNGDKILESIPAYLRKSSKINHKIFEKFLDSPSGGQFGEIIKMLVSPSIGVKSTLEALAGHENYLFLKINNGTLEELGVSQKGLETKYYPRT